MKFYQWDEVSSEVVEFESDETVDFSTPYNALVSMDRKIAAELNGEDERESFIGNDPNVLELLDGCWTMTATWGHDKILYLVYHPTDPKIAKAAIENLADMFWRRIEDAGMEKLGHGRNE